MFKIWQKFSKESEETENKIWNYKFINSEGGVYKTYLNALIGKLKSKRIIVVLCLAIATFMIIKSKDSYNYHKFQFLLFFIGTATIIISEVSVRYTDINNFSVVLFFAAVPIIFFTIFYLFLLNKLKF